MLKQLLIATSLCMLSLSGNATLAQESDQLEAERQSLQSQIDEAEGVINAYDGGMIRSLAVARREALLTARTLLENRLNAEAGGGTVEVIIPAANPDPERAQELLGEMAAAQERIDAAKKEAEGAGGLIQALAISRVETEKLTLAQLQMAYLQAKYGIAFPVIPPTTDQGAGSSASNGNDSSAGEETANADLGGTNLPWADPNYPDVNYELSPFEVAHSEGQEISGWWTIERTSAAIDDSPKVVAINYSAYDDRSYSGVTALIAQCREGETSVVFIQDDYLISGLRRSTLDIAYRIDDKEARSTRWSELTSNKGAGLFGAGSEDFLRELYDAKQFFVRLTEGNGETHDAAFDLSGIENAVEAVATACGWTTLSLTRDDYRAIQTLLNAAGFDTGTPDGVWGPGSKRALRAYQEQAGLPPSGAPDRATLESLGFGG